MEENVGDIATFAHLHDKPTLIQQCGRDQIVDNIGSSQFFRKI